jgi:hypothetical protein
VMRVSRLAFGVWRLACRRIGVGVDGVDAVDLVDGVEWVVGGSIAMKTDVCGLL